MTCPVCCGANCVDQYFAIIEPTDESRVLDIIKSSPNTVFNVVSNITDADGNTELSMFTSQMPHLEMTENNVECINKKLYNKVTVLKIPGNACDDWQELRVM